jgi:quercetin dioxygenase-like cupin family protein
MVPSILTTTRSFFWRGVVMVALVLMAGTIPAGCSDQTPTASELPAGTTRTPASVEAPAPIVVELLTGRHEFTDDVDAQFRLKPSGRPRTVVNFDPSKMAVAKITVQPGARFPWHTHPGPVLVAVKQGTLVYVYADDCVDRTYPTGTGLVDPGNNVHYAFNPTGGETVLIATFLGVPATGPLTIPVDAGASAALDATCGIAPAAVHSH